MDGPGGNDVYTTVTMGTKTTPSGTFFWENPLGATAYTQLRVVLGGTEGSDLRISDPVTLATAQPYGPQEDISDMTVTPPNNGNATPVPNGVDAIPVQVAISPTSALSNPPALAASDPAYKSVYYRFPQGNALVTNLYPIDPTPPADCADPCYAYDSYIGIHPQVTAYPTVGGSKTGVAYDYASTTLSNDDGTVQLVSYVGLAKTWQTTTGTVTVGAGSSVPSSIIDSGDGRNGFSVEGCAEGTCRLPTITATQPALYQAGSAKSGPQLGFQFSTQAVTSDQTLPLVWSGNYRPPLASSGLTTNSSYLVRLTSPNKFVANTTANPTVSQRFDTTLVGHGVSLTLERIPVPPATTSAVRRR